MYFLNVFSWDEMADQPQRSHSLARTLASTTGRPRTASVCCSKCKGTRSSRTWRRHIYSPLLGTMPSTPNGRIEFPKLLVLSSSSSKNLAAREERAPAAPWRARDRQKGGGRVRKVRVKGVKGRLKRGFSRKRVMKK